MSKDKKKYNEIEVKNNMKVESAKEIEVMDEKNIKKVVSSNPKKVKRGLVGRLVHGILGPEGVPSIGAYVNDEIIKPAVKNIIVDAVTSGINMIMYGDKHPRGGGYSRSGYGSTVYRPSVNYSSQYNKRVEEPDRRVKTRYEVDEYVIDDRNDASHVLISLTETADRYGSVSVADYYDMIGAPSQYTDNSYGWHLDSISRATVVSTRGGWIIKFPPVEVI